LLRKKKEKKKERKKGGNLGLATTYTYKRESSKDINK
jgi:hypothetical protein